MTAEAVTSLTDVQLWLRGSLPVVVLLVVGAALVTRFATWVSARLMRRIDDRSAGADALVRSEVGKHRHALAQVITWALLVVVYCLTAVLVVGRLGIPVTGFVAPATVLGVALGFGAQRVVQDLLAGFFLVTERQYGFGDVVRLSVAGTPPATGTVEEVTLRITRIRTLDGEVVITPNGQIVQVTNLSRDWARAVVDVPVPLTADVDRVSTLLQHVGRDAYDDAGLRPLLLDAPTVMGVESLAVDQVNIRMVARTLPGRQFEVGRALRTRIGVALRREGVTVSPTLAADDPAGTPDA